MNLECLIVNQMSRELEGLKALPDKIHPNRKFWYIVNQNKLCLVKNEK